jgi:hypothetical protein
MNDTSSETDSDLFYLVSSITISSIALLGNTIIFYILAKQEFRSQSFFRYLFIGTIFDTISALLVWPTNYPDYFLINEFKVSCNLYQYINDVSSSLSGSIIILTSLDTFLLVKYPTKFKLIKTFKFQMLILLILFMSFCALYSTDWIFMIIDSKSGCVTVSTIIAFYLNLSLGIVSIVIPFLSTFLINISIFFQLRKKQINRNNFKRAKKLFKISVGLDFLFLISSGPNFMIYLISNLSGIRYQLPIIVYRIVSLLSYSYFSLDFFVYLFANRLFKQKFYELIKFSCSLNKKNEAHDSKNKNVETLVTRSTK